MWKSSEELIRIICENSHWDQGSSDQSIGQFWWRPCFHQVPAVEETKEILNKQFMLQDKVHAKFHIFCILQ